MIKFPTVAARKEWLLDYRKKLVRAHENARANNYSSFYEALEMNDLYNGLNIGIDANHKDLDYRYSDPKVWLDSIAYADKLIKGCKP